MIKLTYGWITLTRVLWYCLHATTETEIGPVIATCRAWYGILTDPSTIPHDFGRMDNLGLILHISKTKLTVEQFRHFYLHTTTKNGISTRHFSFPQHKI